jgi:CheY-like chemotaxis protein
MLVVDPDAAFRDDLARAAPAYGLEALGCADKATALAVARAEPPACIVTELVLGGGGDGLELVMAVRKDFALSPTPIVLVTYECDVLARLKALDRGVDILLDKPIKAQLVLAQARALAAMAGRIRDRAAVSSMLRRASSDDDRVDTTPGAPFLGDVEAMPPATALTILEIDQRTGRMTLSNDTGARLEIEVATGYVVSGHERDHDLTPEAAIRAAVAFKRGRFEFVSAPPRPAPIGLTPTTRYLWAAIDDAARSSAHVAATSGPVDEASFAGVTTSAEPPKPKRKADVATSTLVSATTLEDARAEDAKRRGEG